MIPKRRHEGVENVLVGLYVAVEKANFVTRSDQRCGVQKVASRCVEQAILSSAVDDIGVDYLLH